MVLDRLIGTIFPRSADVFPAAAIVATISFMLSRGSSSRLSTHVFVVALRNVFVSSTFSCCQFVEEEEGRSEFSKSHLANSSISGISDLAVEGWGLSLES